MSDHENAKIVGGVQILPFTLAVKNARLHFGDREEVSVQNIYFPVRQRVYSSKKRIVTIERVRVSGQNLWEVSSVDLALYAIKSDTGLYVAWSYTAGQGYKPMLTHKANAKKAEFPETLNHLLTVANLYFPNLSLAIVDLNSEG